MEEVHRDIMFLYKYSILLCLLLIFSSCGEERKDRAWEIICKLESYKLKHGKVPDGLADIGVEEREEGPIYYHRHNDTTFTVWYGESLGESETYTSATQK